jgi:hypothetical protein
MFPEEETEEILKKHREERRKTNFFSVLFCSLFQERERER